MGAWPLNIQPLSRAPPSEVRAAQSLLGGTGHPPRVPCAHHHSARPLVTHGPPQLDCQPLESGLSCPRVALMLSTVTGAELGGTSEILSGSSQRMGEE